MALFKFLFGKVNRKESQPEDSAAEVSAITPASDPVYTVRIAAYDSMSTLPRTVDISSDDFPSFVNEATSRIYALCKEKGGVMPFIVLREAIENLIHADFEDAVVTIMPDGNIVRISDHGPGIQNKTQAVMPGFTSARADERKMIKGVGSGFPVMIESLESLGGFLTIEDNLGSGLVITLHSAAASGATQPVWGSPYPHPHQSGPPEQQASGFHQESGLPADAASAHMPGARVHSAAYGANTGIAPHVYGAIPHQATVASGVSHTPQTVPEQGESHRSAPQRSSDSRSESGTRDVETIVSDNKDGISVAKQDSEVDQSKKKQDEEPPSTSQSSDMSDEALDTLLSSRQKKVFLLIAEMGEIGPSVVTKELDISLSTAYRDLVTLEELGVVVSLEGGKRKLTKRGIDFLSYVFR